MALSKFQARHDAHRDRILLADSSRDTRDALRALLEPMWDVELADDDEAALATAREDPPDLVLASATQPGVDRLELLRALRRGRATATLPVILLSPCVDADAREAAIRAGADDFVVKPFVARDLVACVATRLEVARARREGSRRFDGLAEGIPQGFQVYDAQWRLTYMNSAAERMVTELGLDPCKMRGKHFWDDLFPELRDTEFFDRMQRAMSERLALSFEDRNPTSGRWYQTNVFPLPDGALGSVFSDVTEIRRSRTELEEADRRKDEFLAMLAHELRNPLASVMSGTRLLRRLPPYALECEETRQMIERQVLQLSRLVDDLLDISRVNAGRIVLRTESLDLRNVVSRAVEMSRALIDARRHRLSVSMPGEPAHVEGDAVRLAQVIANLLSNSAKYTDPGGEIRLTAEVSYDEVFVRVADNGIGIASVDLCRIFELFNRVARSQDYAEGGLGIGLTLAKRLVEMHAGSVHAVSEGPGRGSEFIVRLPLAPSAAAARAAPAGKVAAPGPSRRRILLIDDNEAFASAMTGLLQLKGHDVRMVNDGALAVAAARDFKPHVVLLDIGLPGKGGYDIAREMRRDAALTKATLIAMTGYGRAQDQRKAREAGFDHHLTKPVDDEVLSQMIEGAVLQ
jgi:PAS domain S-box-containing protein